MSDHSDNQRPDDDSASGVPVPVDVEIAEASGSSAAIELGQELRSADTGEKVVRGGLIRAIGYGIGALSTLVGSVVLLRYLGAAQFGAFTAVMSITTIAGGIAEGGLTAVGNRELALLKSSAERRKVMSELLGLRLAITPAAGLLAVGFTVVAGYENELILGTALASFGWTLVAVSSSMTIPLSVELKIGSLTAMELIRQVSVPIAYGVLVVTGASLLPFLGAMIPGAAVAIVITPWLLSKGILGWPRFDPQGWWALIVRSLPIAIASIIGVIYLRLLTVLMFQLTSDIETGYFGTSARIIESVNGLPLLAFMVALPVLSAHHKEDPERMHLIFGRMVETGFVFAGLLATGLYLGAEPIIDLLGGAEYAGAIPVLQVQAFSLAGALFAMSCLMAAIAMDHRRTIIAANSFALLTIVVIGVPCILIGDAVGAAVATVIGESAMAIAYYYLIGRVEPDLRPRILVAWKSVLAAAAGIGLAVALPVSDVAATIVGLAVFALVAFVTRAVPDEMFDAVGLKAPRRANAD